MERYRRDLSKAAVLNACTPPVMEKIGTEVIIISQALCFLAYYTVEPCTRYMYTVYRRANAAYKEQSSEVLPEWLPAHTGGE